MAVPAWLSMGDNVPQSLGARPPRLDRVQIPFMDQEVLMKKIVVLTMVGALIGYILGLFVFGFLL